MVVGLVLKCDAAERDAITTAGFDGFYTYFASRTFTYASEWSHWPQLSAFARERGLLFVPSVGPGYDDTRVRPWCARALSHRRTRAYGGARSAPSRRWRRATASRRSLLRSLAQEPRQHTGTPRRRLL